MRIQVLLGATAYQGISSMAEAQGRSISNMAAFLLKNAPVTKVTKKAKAALAEPAVHRIVVTANLPDGIARGGHSAYVREHLTAAIM